MCYFVDKQPPVFEYCPADRYKNTSLGESTASVVWKDPEAFDNFGNSLTVACNPQKGDFPIGCTEVLCKVVDDNANGDTAKCIFNVTVFGKNKTKFLLVAA